ncbi:hypothetical protein, partial [[Eubacterium] cellulosolvens]
PDPASTTSPQNSCPRTFGSTAPHFTAWRSHKYRWMSEPQYAVARTLTRIFRGPTVGFSTLAISTPGFGSLFTTALRSNQPEPEYVKSYLNNLAVTVFYK